MIYVKVVLKCTFKLLKIKLNQVVLRFGKSIIK